MTINPYALPPLLSAVIVSFVGGTIYRHNPKAALNRTFLIQCIAIVLWLSYYIPNINLNSLQDLLSFHTKLSYVGISFISIEFLHCVCVFLNYEWSKPWIILNYLYGGCLVMLILTSDLIIKSNNIFFWGAYPQVGTLHPYFLGIFILQCMAALSFLIHTALSKELSPRKRKQVNYLLAAFGFFFLASFDFIPNYGFEWYPFGYLPTTIFILIVAFGAIKDNLMDFNLVIKRGVIYTILITIISIIYLISVLCFERFFQNIMGYQNLVVSIFTALIIALIFTPLKHRIQLFVEKWLFKGSPLEIAEQNELLKIEVSEKEKFRAVANLASGIAHEVKNPLTSLKTFIEYFPEKKDDPEFLKKCTTILPHEINRIDNLVKQLMDFAKPSIPNFKTIKIKELIEETLVLVQNRIRKQNIVLMQDIPSISQIINADPNKIKQALLNILLNAIEAMPNGGTLNITTRATSHASRAPNFLEISPRASGLGSPPADLAHIFEPFYTKKDTGTGLGLAVTKEIIEQHGGRIKAQSTLNKGTKFIIKLPKRESDRETEHV